MAVEVDIDAEQHSNVVLVPAAAIVREGEETAVFVAVDGKARRRPVQIGLTDGRARRDRRRALSAGEPVIVDGQAGLPDGRQHDAADHRERGEVTEVNSQRWRKSIRAPSCCSRERSSSAACSRPLRCPAASTRRCSFPASSSSRTRGTLPPQSMSLIVTRPIEQVVMAVPGIRRVRSKSIRGAAEISAQFDPVDRHGHRAADGAEPRRGDHRRSAGGNGAPDRADDAGDLSRCSS